MAFIKINTKAQDDSHSGFGTNPNQYGGRFINKNGTANIEKRGLNVLQRTSWYHTLIALPRWHFMLVLFGFYIAINFVFALLYFAIGIEHLDGITVTNNKWVQFGQTYFFSAQTFTTVGYGHISPTGFLTSALSATEALIGLLSFAIATGLFFGRFSQPKAYLKFSDIALISPYRNGKALMVRLVPFKNTNFSDAEAKMTLGMRITENGISSNKFYNLTLELDKINTLTLSWTLVHPIDENSPLYNFTPSDFEKVQGEFLVFIKTFDEMYSNTVAAKTSYTFDEVVYGAKFDPMYHRSNDASKTILDLDKLNHYQNYTFEGIQN
ncbi:ion channel [Flavobacterium agrisoli]|uniref:Inward rectifier potassium channel Irk n=1 Tax=Flavobacterium agrisoli TaxID=2793066 RepID=A0A934PQ13_9FLAO|nr:ion channel [Flavobacterium agrisoli]MBK0371229.1 Inward rectifier potassium channel Irk [Flavobacterium agrisoli]